MDNDLKDILLVGLKDDTVKDEIIAAGLQVSCYVQFHMPDAEIDMAKQSNGFVYLQAKPYATQEKNAKYPTLKDCVEHLRACGIDRPIYCGVGSSCSRRCEAGKRGRWRCGVCRKYNFETARGYSGNERENPRIQSKVLGLSFKYNHNIMEI